MMIITEAFNLKLVKLLRKKTNETNTTTRYFEERNKRFEEKSKSVTNFNYLQWKLHKHKAGGPIYHIFTDQS